MRGELAEFRGGLPVTDRFHKIYGVRRARKMVVKIRRKRIADRPPR
jgi:hypothetical protein